jgi:hypothetical protein
MERSNFTGKFWLGIDREESMEHVPVAKANQPENAGNETCCAKPEASGGEWKHSFRELQRQIGNNAVSRRIQAKLEISQPHDPYELEADRVADQIMRMPDRLPRGTRQTASPQIQRMCTDCQEEMAMRQTAEEEEEEETAVAGLQAKATDEEEEEPEGLQLDRSSSSPAPRSRAALRRSAVQNVLSSPGQPLDAGTRAFFEPRFGHDFSDVRLHTDAPAASSARAVNALAYTVGRDVVLSERCSPSTSDGMRTLAHELTHVIQQRGSRLRISRYNIDQEDVPYEAGPRVSEIARTAARLQRTATWAAGTERQNWDAADRTMQHLGFGWTPPMLNGTMITSAGAATVAINAPLFSVTTKPAGAGGTATSEASFTANDTNTASYQLDCIDAGPHSVASTKDDVALRATQLGMTAPTQCTGTDANTFKIFGKPDDASHAATILAHERHHASDHKTEFSNVIGAWDKKIDNAITAKTVFSAADPTTAEANMWAAVGGTAAQVATNQHNAWMTANNNFHGSPAGKTKKPTNIQADANCVNASMDHTG